LAREHKPFIKGTRLQNILACSKQLVIDLIEADELTVLPGTKWNRGRNGTPLIQKDSVVRFLKARRLI